MNRIEELKRQEFTEEYKNSMDKEADRLLSKSYDAYGIKIQVSPYLQTLIDKYSNPETRYSDLDKYLDKSIENYRKEYIDFNGTYIRCFISVRNSGSIGEIERLTSNIKCPLSRYVIRRLYIGKYTMNVILFDYCDRLIELCINNYTMVDVYSKKDEILGLMKYIDRLLCEYDFMTGPQKKLLLDKLQVACKQIDIIELLDQ